MSCGQLEKQSCTEARGTEAGLGTLMKCLLSTQLEGQVPGKSGLVGQSRALILPFSVHKDKGGLLWMQDI